MPPSPHGAARRPGLDPWRLALVVLVSLAVLVAHAATFLPFLSDDALISLRYARRFLAGRGLTWNDGEAVEGYTNLLWILLCSGLGALGMDLILAARLLGLAGMGVVVAAVAWAYRPGRTGSAWPALVGGLVVALSSPMAVWAIGGLEQPLEGALLAVAFLAMFPVVDGKAVSWRRAALVGLPLGLLCLTRTDGPLFVAVFAVATLLVRRDRRRAAGLAAALCVLPAVAVLGQLAFRLLYYGDWLPNPAYLKAAVTPHRVLGGLYYMAAGGLVLLPAVGLGALGLVASVRGGRERGRAVLLTLALGAWSVYIAAVGGDIFPAWRHWVPNVVALSFLAAAGTAWWLRGERSGRRRAVLLGALAALLGLQAVDPKTARARRERWEWDGQAIGRFLRQAFGPQRPLIAVNAAGCVPYFSGLPAVDMLGLNDRHIARRPPAPGGWIGHDRGDGRYVLDRQPDLVFLGGKCHGAARPSSVGGRQMVRDPRFRRGYRLVTFLATSPRRVRARAYVRLDGRAGIQRGDGIVTVPAYLLGGSSDVLGMLDAAGRVGARLPAAKPLRLPALDLEPGRWRVELVPERPEAVLAVRDAARGEPLSLDADGRAFQVPGAEASHRIEMELRVREPAFLRSLRLRRQGAEPTTSE